MGKLNVFEISLSNKQDVYYAGQVLQGHVIIELNEPVKLKGIRITFRGRAFVHWTEQLMRGPGESRFREIRHHSATEEYFDVSHSLIPRGSGLQDDKKVLAPGQYTYPFQFELPANLPSSFEGQYGFLRYWVKVTIEKPWKNDYTTKKVFTVICPMDLNREPTSGSPIEGKKTKRLCCLCCRSGPVSAVLCVQQKGYVPGEAIQVTGEVNNMSSRKMGGSSVELKMTTVFHATNKTRAVTQQVSKLKRGPISSGDSDLWEGEKLVIPPLPPSYLLGCSLIDIRYIIELRVDPVGPAFDLSVPLEIFIGTIPVRSAVQRYIRNNQISPPTISRLQLAAQQIPSLNLKRSNSPLSSMYSPQSPASLSQSSTPDSVFSYRQQPYGYPQPGYHQPHHVHFEAQGYPPHGYGYGPQTQPQGYGPQTQPQGYGPQTQPQGYGPIHGYGASRQNYQNINMPTPSTHLYQNLGGPSHSGHLYPYLPGVEVRQPYREHAPEPPRPTHVEVVRDPNWMPSPSFSEYFFGQRCIRDDDDEENTRGDVYYTPLYVYYDFEKPRTEGKPTRTVRITS